MAGKIQQGPKERPNTPHIPSSCSTGYGKNGKATPTEPVVEVNNDLGNLEDWAALLEEDPLEITKAES